MKDKFISSFTFLSVMMMALLLSPSEVSAYVGPGPGLSFITTLIGFLVAIFTSLFVIIIYPIRKFMKRKKEKEGKPQPVVNQSEAQKVSPSEEK